MKLSKGLNRSKAAMGLMLLLSNSLTYAAAPVVMPKPANIYVALFGGIASPNSYSVAQSGTAYYFEAAGGPLAVNAFGNVNGGSEGLFGGKVGYQWAPILIHPNNTEWGFMPAVELEGYAIGRNNFTGTLGNNTARLPEHTFNVSYPTRTNVFLMNLVLSLDAARLGRFQPYVGAGIGGAFNQVTSALATQVAPPEVGVNHYNANPDGKSSAIAGQVKLGLTVAVTQCISVFAEYQWLYVAATSYTFGSTVYVGHPETSGWSVSMNPQQYNTGTLGIQLNV